MGGLTVVGSLSVSEGRGVVHGRVRPSRDSLVCC